MIIDSELSSVTPFRNSILNSASYLLDDRILVDCGDWHTEYSYVRHVFLTHAHFDHIFGLNILFDHCPDAAVYTNETGVQMLIDSRRNLSRYHESPFVFEHRDRVVVVSDGDMIDIEGVSVRAVATPGHNASCISWIIGKDFFTGDSYIPGVKTVTNLPWCDRSAALLSEAKIRSLSEDYCVRPGHILDPED